MSSVKQVYIAVVGAGGVGRHFLSQLSLLSQTNPNISLVLISQTTKSLRATSPSLPLSLKTWSHDLSSTTTSALSVPQTLTFLADFPSPRILIDNTSSQALATAYPTFLTQGISIVTPNKKAFSSTLDLWTSIRESAYHPSGPNLSHGHIYHESTVGAGLPIISTLTDLLATGDKIHRIEGIFSGTLSFLFNNFAPQTGAGGTWSETVLAAKAAGYTEPDPRDDLNGVDVARKLVILARIAGLQIESTDSFPVESLIPAALAQVGSGEEFLARLPEFDSEMEEVRDGAAKEGKVVRFVGSVDMKAQALRVGLEKVEKGHAFAGLKGSDNVVSFYTERYGEMPLVVQGAGAGGAVTAMGVTADLIKVIQRVS